MLDEKLLQDARDDIENADRAIFETGFDDLDILMGLKEGKGALITIGARPAMGKTTFMLSIAENILKLKKKVLIFSLCMSDVQMTKKFMLVNAEIPPTKVILNKLTAQDFEKLDQTLDAIKKWDLIIDDKSNIAVKEIEEKIKENKPDVVFIDYLQAIAGEKKMDKNSQLEDICTNLKRISRENNIPVFVTSQLSRAGEMRYDKHPLLSDLRDSSSIENLSDIVIFLYRETYYPTYAQNDDIIRRKGETEIIIAKNKFGICGTLSLIFSVEMHKFYNYRSKRL